MQLSPFGMATYGERGMGAKKLLYVLLAQKMQRTTGLCPKPSLCKTKGENEILLQKVRLRDFFL